MYIYIYIFIKATFKPLFRKCQNIQNIKITKN